MKIRFCHLSSQDMQIIKVSVAFWQICDRPVDSREFWRSCPWSTSLPIAIGAKVAIRKYVGVTDLYNINDSVGWNLWQETTLCTSFIWVYFVLNAQCIDSFVIFYLLQKSLGTRDNCIAPWRLGVSVLYVISAGQFLIRSNSFTTFYVLRMLPRRCIEVIDLKRW